MNNRINKLIMNYRNKYSAKSLSELRESKSKVREAIIVPPSRREIAELLKNRDEDALVRIGKRFISELIEEKQQLASLGVPQSALESIDQSTAFSSIDDIDYLSMSVDGIEEWYSYLFDYYCHLRKEIGILKRKREMKDKYYHLFCKEVDIVQEELSEMTDSGIPEYLDFVAQAKAQLPDDYVDMVPYSDMSEEAILKKLEELRDLKDEVSEKAGKLREEIEKIKDLETGAQSLSVLGIDKISDLDDILRKQREEKDRKMADTIKAATTAVSALHGNKDSLASIFSQVDLGEPVEKAEASESDADESYELADDYIIVDSASENARDITGIDSSEKGNPKGN